MTNQEILAVRDLSLELRTGPRQQLVKGVSFTLKRQKVLGLVGQSGCGKSLTCLAVMGLLPPVVRQVSGEILVDGLKFRDMPPGEVRSLRGKKAAMILQNPMSCFDSVFTIKHHFRETLASHGLGDRAQAVEAARQALVEVGFDNPDEILGLYPFQMSGGMLQRVMVALALMMKVSLLIADEPTTDLDVVSQARILNLLAAMRRDHGMSILLVTHDLSVIARSADDVAVMKDGAIVESGPVETIFNHGRHPYTQALLKAHWSLYGTRLTELLGISGNRRQTRSNATL